ncbi:hypothetical protein LguiA_021850 [Lonicera macranthoides]
MITSPKIILGDDAAERFSRAQEILCKYARGVPSYPAAAAAALGGSPDLAAGAPGIAAGAAAGDPGRRTTRLSAGVTGPATCSAPPFCSFDDWQHGPLTTHTQHSLQFCYYSRADRHRYRRRASSSNKRRGVVLGKKTAAITKEKDRTPVTYENSIRGPPFSVRSRFVTDLSAYIKDRCPMLHPTWHDLPVTERTRLLDFLSVNYDIDHQLGLLWRRIKLNCLRDFNSIHDEELITHYLSKKIIDINFSARAIGEVDMNKVEPWELPYEKAANQFRQWKSSCHTNWQELGDTPLPVEFAHRLAEWQWLCNHFRDPEFQRRSQQMKAIQASTNKRPHSGGARPFASRAEKYTKKGEQAPHAKTYIDMYKKFDPEGTSRVQQASDEAVASLMESMPPIEDTSDGTSPASVTAPPRLSVDVEIGLMERVVGPSRGTRVPGLGSGVAKQPMTRGPSRPEPRNAAIEEEFA